jgi:hypothetical protein
MKTSVILGPAALLALLVGAFATTPVMPPQGGVPSARSLQTSVEAALERGDLSTAVRMTDAAYRRAISDSRWESLIEVGDLYYRIVNRTGAERASQRARDAYQAALRSARHAGSLEGVLRAAEAFAQLGDVDETQLTLYVARDLAGYDAEAVADVRAAAARLSDLLGAASAEDRGEE